MAHQMTSSIICEFWLTQTIFNYIGGLNSNSCIGTSLIYIILYS